MTALQNEETAEKKTRRSPYRFGDKLKIARERKGYTLKIVATKAGVSESLVSQIERNKVSPAIDTLLNLAEVLDINLEFLFEEYRRQRPVEVIRKSDRRQIVDENTIYDEIAHPNKHDGQNAMEAYMLTVPKGETTHRGSYGHIGREIGLIIEGQCELRYENIIYNLEEGDSVSFSSNAPHILVNTGSSILKALWVVSPAQRFTE